MAKSFFANGRNVTMADEKTTLLNNVTEVVEGYLNGMEDHPEDYPEMSIEEARKYCTSQIYDIYADGKGFCREKKGICDHLRFLGNDYIYSVIDKVAKENGILKSDSVRSEILGEIVRKEDLS